MFRKISSHKITDLADLLIKSVPYAWKSYTEQN